ncbi:MAG: RNA methyltransferase [Pseudomonadota bacterium]
MSDKQTPKTMSDAHNSFHAEKRRARRDKFKPAEQKSGNWKRKFVERDNADRYLMYGLHTIRQALCNPQRECIKLYATKNGLSRLELPDEALQGFTVEEKLPRDLDKLVGSDAVHQGVVLDTKPLKASSLQDLSQSKLILLLDQITDPHNVGAIMRSAVAMDAGALITTSRFSPIESGVLAKSASGALDLIAHIEVRNLSETLESLHDLGYTTIALDSEEAIAFEAVPDQGKIALVLGAEGKGLRQKVRNTCKIRARLDMPGEIKSLNVSNAAVLALYLSRQKLT